MLHSDSKNVTEYFDVVPTQWRNYGEGMGDKSPQSIFFLEQITIAII